MFERFTDTARRVLVLAQEEARILNHNFIGTEHILLGLLHEGEGVAAQALGTLGVDLYNARGRVVETVGPAGASLVGSPPFTPRAKKVLELSLREALQLGHNYIGTEHLLLGLVQEGGGVGAQVLVRMGADLSRVRQQVLELLAAGPGTAPGPSGGKEQRGPLCSWCRSELSGSARFKTIDVPSDETEAAEGPRQATVFYCSRCGTVLSPATAPGALLGGRVLGARVSATARTVPREALEETSRHFPEELLAPANFDDVPKGAKVELYFRDGQLVEGMAGAAEVRLVGSFGSSRGYLAGTWATAAIAADWRFASTPEASTDPSPGSISGRLGDDALQLTGRFHFRFGCLFEKAEIAGQLCGQGLGAEVRRAGGGLGPTSTVVAEGTLGEASFEIFATVSTEIDIAKVRGSFDGRPVLLDASRDELSGSVRIAGAYDGPVPLLALVVGSLAHFL